METQPRELSRRGFNLEIYHCLSRLYNLFRSLVNLINLVTTATESNYVNSSQDLIGSIIGSMEESRTLMLNLTLVHRQFRDQIFNISLLE